MPDEFNRVTIQFDDRSGWSGASFQQQVEYLAHRWLRQQEGLCVSNVTVTVEPMVEIEAEEVQENQV